MDDREFITASYYIKESDDVRYAIYYSIEDPLKYPVPPNRVRAIFEY
jgi:hypothetical protein